jgi:alpha-galactosidase
MPNAVRIAVIGAGGSFVAGLVHDLCLAKSLAGSTLVFMDINPERLDSATRVCRRLVAEMDADLKIEQTEDRKTALIGADFVVTIALIDGPRRLSEGWKIAEKHGIHWSGSFHILYDEPFWLNFYQLRLFESITEDMIDLCPNATHLLVSNPVITATTHLSRKYPKIRMVGLCHGFQEVNRIAEVLKLDVSKLQYRIPGVNHFVWVNQLFCEGQDVFPLIDRWLASGEAEEYWKATPEGILGKKKMDLYRKYGVIPVGDSASITGASWPWEYHTSKEVEAAWGADCRTWWWKYVEGITGMADKLKRIADNTTASVNTLYGMKEDLPTGETMVPVMEGLAGDVPQTVVVNVLNDGKWVEGLPEDFEVEVHAFISSAGISPLKTKPLPRAIISHIIRDRVAPVEMELAAHESGSMDLLKQLVMMDRSIRSEKQAEALIEEIFALPYHQELRDWYR